MGGWPGSAAEIDLFWYRHLRRTNGQRPRQGGDVVPKALVVAYAVHQTGALYRWRNQVRTTHREAAQSRIDKVPAPSFPPHRQREGGGPKFLGANRGLMTV